MKILSWFEPPAGEVEVDVGIDEVKSMLKSAVDSRAEAVSLVGAISTGLKGIDDALIAEMTVAQRKIIADFFREQADRFLTDEQLRAKIPTA